MLSPFMPFITEEIWHAVYDGKPPKQSIALAGYPQQDPSQTDTAAETEMAILQDLIVAVRNIRAELKVETRQKTPIEIHADGDVQDLINGNRGALERLANVERIEFVRESLAKAAGGRSSTRFDVRVVYEKKVDVAAERERLTKEIERFEKELGNAERQLGNEAFLGKAPAKVVDGLKKRHAELRVLLEKARSGLANLK
jgi:valyl-tRNA synthetase